MLVCKGGWGNANIFSRTVCHPIIQRMNTLAFNNLWLNSLNSFGHTLHDKNAFPFTQPQLSVILKSHP